MHLAEDLQNVARHIVRPAPTTCLWDQWLAQSVATRRFNLLVIATFAITALLLAGIGIYSVAAEAVILRTREIGVRAALGATDSQLKSTIMRGGLAPVVAGFVLGTVGALAKVNVVTSFLYGVPAHDPLTLSRYSFLSQRWAPWPFISRLARSRASIQ